MVHTILNRTTIVLFFLAAPLILIACNDRPQDRGQAMQDDDVRTETTFEDERDQLVNDLEDLRDDLDERIDELNSRIEDDEAQADEDLIATRNELQQDRAELDQHIDRLQDTSEENWANVRNESQDLYNRVSNRLDEWAGRFEDEMNN